MSQICTDHDIFKQWQPLNNNGSNEKKADEPTRQRRTPTPSGSPATRSWKPIQRERKMAFTFAAFSYICALIVDAFLIFFAIFHVSDKEDLSSRSPASCWP